MSQELVEVEGEILHHTQLAYLVLFDDDEVWLPKSQATIEKPHDPDTQELIDKGTMVTFSIPEWLAIEKELV